ncbi:MAG: hypothetical protein PGN27_05435 [Mycolicibacterium neoaurum]|uniref:hypothetical protein n=1 Tax=Mycolicibacterium neoaurum TaxID=1795 RepID=UPI002FFABE8C
MAARRSPWMDDRAQLLVRLLDEHHGLQISEDVAREDVSSHVDLVAERMRIGRQAAKVYVTDDYLAGLADHIARAVNQARTREALAPPVRPSHLRVVRLGDDA